MFVPPVIAFPLVLLSIMALTACRDSSSSSSADSEHRFAVVYSNVAWQHKQIGLVINPQGELFWFDTTSAMREPLIANAVYDGERLNQWFPENSSYLERISSAQHETLFQTAPRLSNAPLADAENICADAGLYQYFYFHPLDNHQYKAVLIYQTGDWRRLNTAEASETVKNLLIQKALHYQVAFELNIHGNNWCSGM